MQNTLNKSDKAVKKQKMPREMLLPWSSRWQRRKIMWQV